MKLQWKILISISVLLNCIFFAALALPILNRWLNPSPPPDITSVFLRSYTPMNVVGSYRSQGYGSGWSETKGGWSASRGNFNERAINPNFAIQTDKELLLMTALKKDVYTQLAAYGGTVLSENPDSQGGFLFNYRIGTNTGILTLSPLVPYSGIKRNSPLPDGIEDMSFAVTIAEKPQ